MSAPPELPGEIGALVWSRPAIGGAPLAFGRLRPVPDTIPVLAVSVRPRGDPIATTNVPTRAVVVAHFATGKLSRATVRTAVSESGSAARTLPATRWPSANCTVIDVAPAMTWLLVTI